MSDVDLEEHLATVGRLRAEIERLHEDVAQIKRHEMCLMEEIERLKVALREALVSWEENRAFPEDQIRAALEGEP